MEVSQNVKINTLLDLYGALLTKHQQVIMAEYYGEDLSLAEIAAIHQISRNAVFAVIKACEEKLGQYEDKLHLLEKQYKISRMTSNLEPLSKEQLLERMAKIAEINEG